MLIAGVMKKAAGSPTAIRKRARKTSGFLRRKVLDCASPLALWGATVSFCGRESARGLAQSKTLRAAPQSSKCSKHFGL
jgi:hypothetical protein